MDMMWKIGQVEIENPFVLAPMAGVTDLPFSQTLQGTGGRSSLYRNGQCKSNFFS
mgnify:CR=1 FL=1